MALRELTVITDVWVYLYGLGPTKLMGDGQTSGHGRRLVIEKLRQVLLGAIGELTLITEPTDGRNDGHKNYC